MAHDFVYYAELDLYGYRWRGFSKTRRFHYFASPDGAWICLADDEWQRHDFKQQLDRGTYYVPRLVAHRALKAKIALD